MCQIVRSRRRLYHDQGGEGTGGGIMKQIPDGPTGWLAYVEVADIRSATKTAKSLGGEVLKDATEVIGMGWVGLA